MRSTTSPFNPDLYEQQEDSNLLSQAYGETFQALRGLTEARSYEDGAVILEGNFGGQIYLACPVSAVLCSDEAIRSLLEAVDGRCWGDPQGARVFYRRLPVGSIVAGGMGGGRVQDELWVHDEVRELGLVPMIKGTLFSDSDS